jgi:hypothetical protein
LFSIMCLPCCMQIVLNIWRPEKLYDITHSAQYAWSSWYSRTCN